MTYMFACARVCARVPYMFVCVCARVPVRVPVALGALCIVAAGRVGLLAHASPSLPVGAMYPSRTGRERCGHTI